ncbi:hypothetical protein IGI04_006113 [Brassica rapa subsp. trilocularis]|uniref:Uncharacterized protein n=1 Tax=Brassica rapa subsp. trilocularis TaxID=1813537 RepID=A0ABQ7NFZ4_BRACM|nr:hypothetical protein IGI04_006113 [Brassica rapa subsp. trilocularis]
MMFPFSVLPISFQLRRRNLYASPLLYQRLMSPFSFVFSCLRHSYVVNLYPSIHRASLLPLELLHLELRTPFL